MIDAMTGSPAQDDVLLAKLNAAVKAANEAETSVMTAQAELISRSKVVGQLLLEAKRLHPSVEDFEAYLRRVDGLKLSRAYDLMRVAGGRTTDEELRKEARERQQKARAKSKTLPKAAPNKDSVTSRNPPSNAQIPKQKAASAAAASSKALREFEMACKTCLPEMNATDLKKARAYFSEGRWKPKKEAA